MTVVSLSGVSKTFPKGNVTALQGIDLQITLWSYVVFGAAGVFSGVMRASGTVLIPTALSIFAVLGIEVPVAYFLSKTSLGIDGIWIAYPVAFAAMLLMQSAYFQFVWRKKTITRLI